jgi:lysine 2,3-aminomutase
MGIPHLVIDAPGGGGKIPVGPNYVLAWGPDRVTLRDWQHRTVTYVEPSERDCACPYDEVWRGGGARG